MLCILNVWCTYRSVLVAILPKRFLFEIDGEAVGLMSLSLLCPLGVFKDSSVLEGTVELSDIEMALCLPVGDPIVCDQSDNFLIPLHHSGAWRYLALMLASNF